jgi:hypothetical protein
VLHVPIAFSGLKELPAQVQREITLAVVVWEVVATGSRSCPMVNYHISGVEPSGFATRVS